MSSRRGLWFALAGLSGTVPCMFAGPARATTPGPDTAPPGERLAEAGTQPAGLNHQHFRQGVAERYGAIIDGMALSSPVKVKLLERLAIREETLATTRERLRAQHHRAQLHVPPSADLPMAAQIEAEARRAVAPIDRELRAMLGATAYARVSAMIAASLELGEVSRGLAPMFAGAGCPITPQQCLELAVILHAEFNPQTNPRARSRRSLPLDSSNLNEIDRAALRRMQRVLSDQQVELMRQTFVLTERGIHQIPTAWEFSCKVPPNAAELIAGHIDPDRHYGTVAIEMHGSAAGRPTLSGCAIEVRDYCAVPYIASFSDKNGSPFLLAAEGTALFDDQGRLVAVVGASQVAWTHGRPKPRS
ncbi:MAG TPA: hypothetical protein VHE13_17595 [Opitutus sp.]|nr:hypothetical protein [Opitutus sp.]